MEFHVVCWRGDDVGEEEEEEDGDEENQKMKMYKINIFGKMADGRSVCCTVPYFPFFYVSLPDGYRTATDALHIRDRIMSKMGRRFRPSVVVDACTMVRRKKFYGFSNGATHPFLRMVFRTRHAYAVAAKIITSDFDDLEIFESNVDPVLKLIHQRDLDSAGWIRVAAWKKAEPSVSRCNEDIEAMCEDLHRIPPDQIPPMPPPLVMASFDIEANSHDGGFPNPDLEGNEVIQIATVFQRYGEPLPFAREIMCLGQTSEIPGVDVRCFGTEPELLAAWSQGLQKHHADVLVGYNIWGFDMQYMYKRAMFHYDSEKHRLEFLNIGKLCRADNRQSSLRKTVLSSSAYGHNEFLILETPGILQIDLMHVLQKEHKLESYSLNNVSKHFLGDTKLDMPARKMFDLYATKDPDNLRQIAEYCVKDCELPLLLMTKLAVIPNMIEMAKATHVPMEFLIPRGQQIKVFSQIMKRLLERGYVCPSNPRRPRQAGGSDDGGGYVGATVLEPRRGAYMDHPISTLDFASLYPSIMRSHRLCPSTIVLDTKYANVQGVEYLTIEVEGTTYKFAQNTEAIVPDLLRDLAGYRKQAKKDMAQAKREGDAFMTSVYDGKQLAIKVSMNSVYGFFGATNGYLPCAPIAAAVTTIGRQMIDATKNFVEANYPGSEVVYGDSVMPYTPIFVKHATTGFVSIRRIDQVFKQEDSVAYPGFVVGAENSEKQRYEPREPLLTWTHLGWQPIKRVIRHLCPDDKRVYRVRTPTAVVDVTEDHSLLDPEGNLLKPQDIGPGTRLMHGVPPAAAYQVLCPEGEDYQVAAQHAFVRTGRRESGIVTEVRVLHASCGQYVYDLETEAGSFQAGIGGLIVKNTDSVMIKFGPEDVETCFRLGQEAADAATKLFKDPIKLEFEKVFHPYFLFAKKRYCGVKITSLDEPGVLDFKGIQLARRDNCPMVRTVSRKVLDALMFRRDPDEASEIVRGVTRDLLENKIDVRDLVLSKTLKPESSYKNPNQPHVYVARKMEQRHGLVGSGPRSGERVPYVFVEDENPMALQCTKAEDPAHVLENGLRIDALYYLEHQLESPMVSLFELLIPDPQKTLFDDLKESYVRRRKEDLKEFKRKEKLKKNKQHEITSFFRKSVPATPSASSPNDPRQ